MAATQTGTTTGAKSCEQPYGVTLARRGLVKKLEGHATVVLVVVAALSAFLLWGGYSNASGGPQSLLLAWIPASIFAALLAVAHIIALALSIGAAILIFNYGMICAFGDQQPEQSPDSTQSLVLGANLRTLL
ncbi:MAG: hypothetical protein HKN11_15140 [Rhizobiales bacterium]|nr:hypothetical protein [Hyphomicrobiales bacterium]